MQKGTMIGYRAGGGFLPCDYHYWKCFDDHILAPSVGTLAVVVLMGVVDQNHTTSLLRI